MDELKIVPKGHNKSVYFIMPLVGMNKNSFGEGNFINSYVSYNGKLVVVIKDKEESGDYTEHPHYLTDFDVDIDEHNRATAIVFEIPDHHVQDMALFLEGKYSKMSELAKSAIKAGSALPYREPDKNGKTVNTHKMLYVIDDPTGFFRTWLSEQLGTEVKGEMMDKPDYDSEYMDIDTIIV